MTAQQLDILGRSFLFVQVSPPQIAQHCAPLVAETILAGEAIYSQHHFRPAVAILLSGQAEVKNCDQVVLNSILSGDCFGVAAVFHPVEEYVTTVVAMTEVTLVYLTDQWLQALFAAEPVTAVNYISFLSQKICFLNRKIDSFTANTAQDAVVLWLTRHRIESRVALPPGGYTRLAKELNLGRASLYRALDALEAGGKIVRERKAILLNPNGTRGCMKTP